MTSVSAGSLAIVGGGRWARVLVREARRALPTVRMSVHSPSNAEGMRGWVAEQGWELPVHARWPHEVGSFTAVVVANRAREHTPAALSAMTCARAVLVEKPMALTPAAVSELRRAAEEGGCLLCAAHVLSFTRYLRHFVAGLPGLPTSLDLQWDDPSGEMRYGEQRQYDGTISASDDLMPHILSVLDPVVGGCEVQVERTTIERGGARTLVQMWAGPVRVSVRIERDAPTRRRHLEARYADDEAHVLQFNPEPGVIRVGGQERSGDPEWGQAPSPLTLLFQEFWRSCQEGRYTDERLSLRVAFNAAAVCQAINDQCHAQMEAWLTSAPDADAWERAYATRELAAYRAAKG